MFGKCFIAGYRELGASRVSVYALRKRAPRDGLRDDDVRGNYRWKITCEAPAILRPEKTMGRHNRRRFQQGGLY
jgi:hypothetical protein